MLNGKSIGMTRRWNTKRTKLPLSDQLPYYNKFAVVLGW